MAIADIKNKYLRRTAVVAFVPACVVVFVGAYVIQVGQSFYEEVRQANSDIRLGIRMWWAAVKESW